MWWGLCEIIGEKVIKKIKNGNKWKKKINKIDLDVSIPEILAILLHNIITIFVAYHFASVRDNPNTVAREFAITRTRCYWSYIPPRILPPVVTWSWREEPDSGLEGSGGGWANCSAPEGAEGWTLQGRAKRRVRRTLGWRLATVQPALGGLCIPN